jgi:hypothetical protein
VLKQVPAHVLEQIFLNAAAILGVHQRLLRMLRQRVENWCVVCGVWCVVCGVWCVVCGVVCVYTMVLQS